MQVAQALSTMLLTLMHDPEYSAAMRALLVAFASRLSEQRADSPAALAQLVAKCIQPLLPASFARGGEPPALAHSFLQAALDDVPAAGRAYLLLAAVQHCRGSCSAAHMVHTAAAAAWTLAEHRSGNALCSLLLERLAMETAGARAACRTPRCACRGALCQMLAHKTYLNLHQLTDTIWTVYQDTGSINYPHMVLVADMQPDTSIDIQWGDMHAQLRRADKSHAGLWLKFLALDPSLQVRCRLGIVRRSSLALALFSATAIRAAKYGCKWQDVPGEFESHCTMKMQPDLSSAWGFPDMQQQLMPQLGYCKQSASHAGSPPVAYAQASALLFAHVMVVPEDAAAA